MKTSLFAALAVLTMMSTSQPAAQKPSASTAAPSLDFEFFKTRVEPIFLKRRPGHARCYVCHSPSGEGTEEQSRRNFELVSRLVTPGQPLSSRLLMHPLWHLEAGGDPYHEGGRQFASQNDPDWVTLAEWVRGQKAGGSSGK